MLLFDYFYVFCVGARLALHPDIGLVQTWTLHHNCSPSLHMPCPCATIVITTPETPQLQRPCMPCRWQPTACLLPTAPSPTLWWLWERLRGSWRLLPTQPARMTAHSPARWWLPPSPQGPVPSPTHSAHLALAHDCAACSLMLSVEPAVTRVWSLADACLCCALSRHVSAASACQD